MAKVIFLLGLAGSGKSHYADEFEIKIDAKNFEGIAGDHYPNGVKEVIEHLKSGKNCTVEEIAFCDPYHRNIIIPKILSEVPNVEIEWFCIENNLEIANSK